MAVRSFSDARNMTQSHLTKGYLKSFEDMERGAKDFVAKLSFVDFTGDGYSWQIQTGQLTEPVTVNIYGDEIPSGVGKMEKPKFQTATLAADAFTNMKAIAAHSDYIPQKKKDADDAIGKIGTDFVFGGIHGMYHQIDENESDVVNLCGFEGALEYWAGVHNPASAPALSSRWGRPNGAPLFHRQKMWGTSTGKVDGNAEGLNSTMLRFLRKGNVGNPFQVWWVDEATCVEIENIIETVPGGNTEKVVMDEDFGRNVLTFLGTPVMVLDAVGGIKSHPSGGNATSGAANVTVPLTDDTGAVFVGFSDLDIGRSLTITDGVNTETKTIVSITNSRTVVVDSNFSNSYAAADSSISLSETNAIYAVDYNVMNGFHAVYHKGTQGSQAPADELHSQVLGFRAYEFGPTEKGRKELTQFTWMGQMIAKRYTAIRRLAGYSLTAASNKYFYA